MNKIWKLYIHTNKTNGKKYVGITSRKNVNERWMNGKGYALQVFGKAIEKYGWDGFEHEIVETGNEDTIKKLEKDYITKLKTHMNKYGYNITMGGEGVKRSPEALQKLRDQRGKTVYQYDMNCKAVRIYGSMNEAKTCGLDMNSIRKCCIGELKFYNGYIFSYHKMFEDDMKNHVEYEEHRYDKIHGYSINEKVHFEYEYLEDVVDDEYGVVPILSCCERANDIYDGCLWSYEKLEDKQVEIRLKRAREIKYEKTYHQHFLTTYGEVMHVENLFDKTC